jgi:hypothetical protein
VAPAPAAAAAAAALLLHGRAGAVRGAANATGGREWRRGAAAGGGLGGVGMFYKSFLQKFFPLVFHFHFLFSFSPFSIFFDLVFFFFFL